MFKSYSLISSDKIYRFDMKDEKILSYYMSQILCDKKQKKSQIFTQWSQYDPNDFRKKLHQTFIKLEKSLCQLQSQKQNTSSKSLKELKIIDRFLQYLEEQNKFGINKLLQSIKLRQFGQIKKKISNIYKIYLCQSDLSLNLNSYKETNTKNNQISDKSLQKNKKYSNLSQQNTKLKDQITVLNDQLQRLKVKIVSLQNVIIKRQQNMIKNLKQNKNLNELNTNFSNQIEKIIQKNKNENLQKQKYTDSLRTALLKVSQVNQSLKIKISQIQTLNKNKNQQNELVDKQQNFTLLQQTVYTLNKQLQEINNQCKRLKQNQVQLINQLQVKNKQISNEKLASNKISECQRLRPYTEQVKRKRQLRSFVVNDKKQQNKKNTPPHQRQLFRCQSQRVISMIERRKIHQKQIIVEQNNCEQNQKDQKSQKIQVNQSNNKNSIK